MLPRRFLILSAVAAFAVLTTFLFLNRTGVVLTSPVNIPAGWTDKIEQTWEQAFPDDDDEKKADASAIVNEAVKEDLPVNAAGGFVQNAPVPEHGIVAGTIPKLAPAATISSAWRKPSPFPPADPPLPERINVAIVESGGTNDETTAGLIHAFGQQSRAHLSLYTLQQRYGIGDIINSFKLSHELAANTSSSDFEKDVGSDAGRPDIVVSATCETDLMTLDAPLTRLLSTKKTFLFCVIHQPERWAGQDLTRRIRPWIDSQLVELVTLSQHTAHYLRTQVVNNWSFNATVSVRHLTPLFPVALQDDEFPVTRLSSKDASPTLQYPIAIHGDFDASRHNYTDAFENVVSLKDRAKTVAITTKDNKMTQKRDISLHVFGERVPPAVPKKVKPILSVNREISYLRQYEILSQSYILLPAFSAGDHSDYVSKLASWAIPASIIAGVPIVAGQEILFAYSYLPKEAVWLRYEGETEMKVAERVALWSVEEHRKKKAVVKAVCKQLIERNSQLVDDWVQNSMRKIARQAWRTGKVELNERVNLNFDTAVVDDER